MTANKKTTANENNYRPFGQQGTIPVNNQGNYQSAAAPAFNHQNPPIKKSKNLAIVIIIAVVAIFAVIGAVIAINPLGYDFDMFSGNSGAF